MTTPLLTRRNALLTGLFGSGFIGLKAVATGLPACAGCHGPDGAGMPSQFPRLSGQFADYVETQLKLFRAGGRANDPNGMMRGVAARMSDQEMKAVAEYAAGLR